MLRVVLGILATTFLAGCTQTRTAIYELGHCRVPEVIEARTVWSDSERVLIEWRARCGRTHEPAVVAQARGQMLAVLGPLGCREVEAFAATPDGVGWQPLFDDHFTPVGPEGTPPDVLADVCGVQLVRGPEDLSAHAGPVPLARVAVDTTPKRREWLRLWSAIPFDLVTLPYAIFELILDPRRIPEVLRQPPV